MAFRTRDADVTQTSLFIDGPAGVFGFDRTLMRQESLFHADQIHARKLKPLRAVQRHQLHGLLGAQKGSRKIRGHYRRPILVSEILDRNRSRTDARVIEEEVESTVLFANHGEQRLDLLGIADVGRMDHNVASTGRLFQGLPSSARSDNGVACVGKCMRDDSADSTASACDDCDFHNFVAGRTKILYGDTIRNGLAMRTRLRGRGPTPADRWWQHRGKRRTSHIPPRSIPRGLSHAPSR